MTVQEQLVILMDKSGLRVSEISRRCDVSVGTVYNIRDGKSGCRLNIAEVLAEVLDQKLMVLSGEEFCLVCEFREKQSFRRRAIEQAEFGTVDARHLELLRTLNSEDWIDCLATVLQVEEPGKQEVWSVSRQGVLASPKKKEEEAK